MYYREVPNELVMQARGREISFSMEDNRHAEYAGPAPKLASFSGTGQKLGRYELKREKLNSSSFIRRFIVFNFFFFFLIA